MFQYSPQRLKPAKLALQLARLKPCPFKTNQRFKCDCARPYSDKHGVPQLRGLWHGVFCFYRQRRVHFPNGFNFNQRYHVP